VRQSGDRQVVCGKLSRIGDSVVAALPSGNRDPGLSPNGVMHQIRVVYLFDEVKRGRRPIGNVLPSRVPHRAGHDNARNEGSLRTLITLIPLIAL